MKFHFGHGIAVVLTLFVLTFVWLGIMAHRQDFQLKNDNYYETDRAYPEVFAKKQNAMNAGWSAFYTVHSAEEVCFQLPDTLAAEVGEVGLRFYRPAQKALDKDFLVAADSSGACCLAKSGLARGFYEVSFEFDFRGKSFLVEQNLMVE
jgi:hypothetical protein